MFHPSIATRELQDKKGDIDIDAFYCLMVTMCVDILGT